MEIKEEAAKYYWYHCVDLGNGFVTNGDYDLAPLLPLYGFPKRMAGLLTLDVGRASGFFAFEFERRGADVTAIDIESYLEWDFVGGEQRKEEQRKAIGDERQFSVQHITGAFEFARRVKNSRVKSKYISVYDLKPELFDNQKFDLVFAGSITSHLRDPILALERMYSITKGTCIVAAPFFRIPAIEDAPMMSLVGTMDSNRKSWWIMNERCLVEMMRCANFRNIEIVSEFDLVNRRVAGLVVKHVVVRGYV